MTDPVKLQIFKNLLQEAAEEMGIALRRSAFSPNIKERCDFSCAVFDSNADLIAQAAHIPVHLGSMPRSVASAVVFHSFQPGDIVILNDPFHGGTHLPDVTLVEGVFIDEKKPSFYVANRAHHADMGGIAPSSMTLATRINQEGLVIPPVLLCERGEPGGECVHRGTIPSKTMRETALSLAGLRRSKLGDDCVELGPRTMVESLMGRLDEVLGGYATTIKDEAIAAGIELVRGRARFVSATEVEVLALDGTRRTVTTEHVVIAVGSRPRTPPNIPVDHEHVLDSDSLLDMIYLPESLTVVGAGVIASEFASVFQTLGVQVTMLDRYAEPLGFVDPEIGARFRAAFEAAGGTFLGEVTPESVRYDGVGGVVTELSNGETLRTHKMLVAQGRTASVRGLGAEDVGVTLTSRGLIEVDEHYRTCVPNVYAIGDVIGPPALAASSMNQGRRAVRHALGVDPGPTPEDIPAGIYTIPELAFVGLTEAAARERHGDDVLVGRADFAGIARARINGAEAGFLKLVTDPTGRRILGVHVVGEGAVELVHLGQLARVGDLGIDVFVDEIFNFPTFAEAYRVAALDVIGQRAARERDAAA